MSWHSQRGTVWRCTVGCQRWTPDLVGHRGGQGLSRTLRRRPVWTGSQDRIYCTGSYDAIEILHCLINVGGAFGFVGMHTMWMLVRPQSRESFVKESLYLCRTCLSPWRSTCGWNPPHSLSVEFVHWTQCRVPLHLSHFRGFEPFHKTHYYL